jgi:hypothetical protein
MSTLPLNEFVSITLDGAGAGTARIGPNAHGVIWRPTVVSVRVSTQTKSPTCLIYAGSSATADNFVDGTYTGAQNSSSNIEGQVLLLGNYVWAVWAGGDAGAQATLTVTGSKDLG